MKKVRGFALVDLLAVVPLVAILVVLFLPVIHRAREAARRAKCAGHLHWLGRALAQYMCEYGSYAPADGGVIQFGWGKGAAWMDKLFPYVSLVIGGKESYPESAASERTKMFRCPSITTCALDGRKYLSSYILNCRLWMDSPRRKFQVARLEHPEKVILLYDRNKWTGDPSDADMTDEWGNKGTKWADQWGPGGLWYYISGGPDLSGPHDGGYNILFADWHVAWFGRWVKGKMTRRAEQ